MSAFAGRATGFASNMDLNEAARALRVLVDPRHAVQMSNTFGGCSVLPGNAVDDMVRSAKQLDNGPSLYVCLNPLPLDLAETLAKRTAEDGKRHQALADDPVRRRWLLVDVDASRADTHQPATDIEHDKARQDAWAVMGDLAGRGWPFPLVIDSGNGWHLLYRVDLPNDAAARTLCRNCLKALSAKYPAVDHETFKANQKTKLPGSWARKGDSTAERPHRMVRLVQVPNELGVVPLEQLAALAGVSASSVSVDQDTPLPFPPGKNGHEQKPFAGKAPSSTGPHPYAQRAYEKELAILAACGPESKARHTQGFKSAAAIGNYIESGRLNRGEVEAALVRILVSNDFPEAEARKTVADGLAKGMSEPKEIPDKPPPGKKAAPEPKTPPAGKRIIRLGSEIEPTKVEWLWPGRIPLSKLTTFAGQTGQGKTFAAVEIMARVTTGDKWPDGSTGWGNPGKVLFISGDDDFDDTIVPRLMEAKADLTQIVFLTEEDQAEWSMAALGTLNIAIDQAGGNVRLVVIDPPTSFMAGVDDHKNAELRAVLTPFKAWAKANRIAVIFITHVNKNGATVSALERVMGSVAWTTGVRTAYMFAKDPDEDRSLFCALKSNLGPKAKTLAYQIVDGTLAGRLEWLGEVDTTADEAVSSKTKSRKECAADWLIEKFRERREWLSEKLFEIGRAQGVGRNAIFEAKKLLNLPRARQVMHENGDTVFVWWVPEDWPPLQPTEAATKEESF